MSGDPAGPGTSPGRVARFDDAGAAAAPATQARLDTIGADADGAATVAEFTGARQGPQDAAPVARLAGPAGGSEHRGHGERPAADGSGATGSDATGSDAPHGRGSGDPVDSGEAAGTAAAPVAELDLDGGQRPEAARTARFGDPARGGRGAGRARSATPRARPDPTGSDPGSPEPTDTERPGSRSSRSGFGSSGSRSGFGSSGFGGRPSRGRAATRRAAADAADRAEGTADGPAAEGAAPTPSAPRRGFGPKQVDPDADPVTAAREICLRLLTDRSRTRHELAQALTKRGVPDDAADTVLSRFDEVGLIDDAAFAGQFVRSRHNQRGLARRAIKMELRRKGVDDEVAEEALEEVDDDAEAGRARELVDRKLRTVPADTPEQRKKAATRLVGMLARKGYGGGIAYRVVREALAAHGAEIDELGTDPLD